LNKLQQYDFKKRLHVKVVLLLTIY